MAVSKGLGSSAKPIFEHNESVLGAGVLLMLPALLGQGLMRTKEVYEIPKNHYYGLESIIMTLAFMALGRIKNPEQLKQCKPGEIGRIIGLDRIPETKCLRDKLKLITRQQNAQTLNNLLINDWYENNRDDGNFLYIDGHQRIYYGYEANLPAKFISRQKLCLSATTEYWVNDATSMPVMMVMGELSEKLQTAIEHTIIPQMLQTNLLKIIDLDNPPNSPQCTFIFDREAYDTSFFQTLWQSYRIAVITYRKNVKDLWDEDDFKEKKVKLLNESINMLVCEKKITLAGHEYREIRKLNSNTHQTSMVTTHPTITTDEVAGRMFSRWSQENFFKYLIADYDFDKMIEFGVETIDPSKQVVNPEYRSIQNKIKKLKEKKGRVQSKFYPLLENVIDGNLDKIPPITVRQAEYKDQIDEYEAEEEKLKILIKDIPPKITLDQMQDGIRFNRLKTESKIFMNVIKMICYRAESAVGNLISPYLNRAEEEKRMFVKQVINNNADLIPDYKNNTLTVVLHSLSAPRYNIAAQKLCDIITQTEAIFPDTNLRMIFKTSAITICEE